MHGISYFNLRAIINRAPPCCLAQLRNISVLISRAWLFKPLLNFPSIGQMCMKKFPSPSKRILLCVTFDSTIN